MTKKQMKQLDTYSSRVEAHLAKYCAGSNKQVKRIGDGGMACCPDCSAKWYFLDTRKTAKIPLHTKDVA